MHGAVMTSSETKYYVGTSGWQYDHWRGVFYPDGLAKTRWFEHYRAHFNSVEINATFYGRFKDSTWRTWRDRAPRAFKYVVKAPRLITHMRHLKNVCGDIETFMRSAMLLGDSLGCVLLQLAPNTPYDPGVLRDALNCFPDPRRVAVEFRDEKWLTDETRAALHDTGSALCNADSPRAGFAGWAVPPIGYYRLHGRSRWYAYDYSDDELAEIARFIRGQARGGVNECFVFFNNDAHGFAVKNAKTLALLLTNGLS